MSRRDRRGQWEYIGTQYEAPTFRNRQTGRVKHIGTEIINGNKLKVWDGYPSGKGYLGGKIVQAAFGTTRDDSRLEAVLRDEETLRDLLEDD